MSGRFEYGKWVPDKESKFGGESPADILRELEDGPRMVSRGADWGSWTGSKCEHRGTPVTGVSGLLGSSVRSGMVLSPGSVTVILTPELLDVLPTGWLKQTGTDVLYWPIKDMTAPKGNLETVQRLVDLHDLHRTGRTVEVACFGGHGRTGLVLAVLAALAAGWNAGTAVGQFRYAYCNKAVETKEQEWFVERAVKACRLLIEDSTGQAQAAQAEIAEPRPLEPAESFGNDALSGAGFRATGDHLSRNAYIRDLRDQGYSLRQIGDMVGLSFQQVSKILLGKR